MRFNKLIPELSVSHFETSLNFYSQILGFKIEYTRDNPNFCFLSLEGSQLMLEEVHKGMWKTGRLTYPYGRGINLQIEIKNIKILLKKIKKKGYPLFRELKENCYQVNKKIERELEFLIMDPDGYLLRFSQYLGSSHLPHP